MGDAQSVADPYLSMKHCDKPYFRPCGSFGHASNRLEPTEKRHDLKGYRFSVTDLHVRLKINYL